jgi:hypothetical protein
MPAGLLLCTCLALPGYRDCGHSVAMAGDPVLVAIGGFGLLAAVLARALRPRGRGERVIAVALITGAIAAAGMLILEWLARVHVYVGVTLATTAAASLGAGSVIWEREAAGRDATALRLLRWLLPLTLAAVAVTAALSDWIEDPDEDPAPGLRYLGPR